MKRLPMVLLAIGVIALAVLLASLTPNRASAQACGPGDHWIDGCPAGVDNFPKTTALVGIDTDLDPNCSEDKTLILSGPVDVDRLAASDDSARFPGLRPVDGHLDVIDTEIVSMTLTGMGITLRVGVNTPAIDPAVPNTFGAVAEQPADPALADSFFDVFFEVDGAPGGPLYNHTPLPLSAVIDRVPPEVVYLHPSPLCLDLFDDPDPGEGNLVARLVRANHNTIPWQPTAGVGGISEPLVDGSGSPAAAAEDSGSSAPPYAAIAGGLAAAAVVVAVGGWYARRRWMR